MTTKTGLAAKIGAVALGAAMLPASADALIVTQFPDVGGNVEATASGSMDAGRLASLWSSDFNFGWFARPSPPSIWVGEGRGEGCWG